MQNRLAIGVDIGGTKIAYVLIDEQGAVLAQHQLATGVEDGTAAVLDRVTQGIKQLTEQAGRPVAGIGLGSPGYCDPSTGIVRNAVNLGWDEVDLLDGIRQRLGDKTPLWLQKDTNAAVLGEIYFGTARGYKDVVLVAVGTGLGMGAVVDGRILNGANSFATDIGHLVLKPGGRLCSCGQHGCIEMYVSGHGVAAGIQEHRPVFPESPLAQIEAASTAAIIQGARDGDPLARMVMDEAAEWLGMIFAYCGALLNPSLFVLGGGLGLAAADLLLAGAEHEFRRRVLPIISDNAKIVQSQVSVSAVGAACLVWNGTK